MIYLSGVVTASTPDLLTGTRLSSIPYTGAALTIQTMANLNNSTNRFAITIQLPDGSTPVDAQPVSAGRQADALGGQLDANFLDQWTFPAPQGGHFIIAFTETGAAIAAYRVVLTP